MDVQALLDRWLSTRTSAPAKAVYRSGVAVFLRWASELHQRVAALYELAAATTGRERATYLYLADSAQALLDAAPSLCAAKTFQGGLEAFLGLDEDTLVLAMGAWRDYRLLVTTRSTAKREVATLMSLARFAHEHGRTTPPARVKLPYMPWAAAAA